MFFSEQNSKKQITLIEMHMCNTTYIRIEPNTSGLLHHDSTTSLQTRNSYPERKSVGLYDSLFTGEYTLVFVLINSLRKK